MRIRGLDQMSASHRYDLAIKKVLVEEWSISEAARIFKIARPHLSKRVKAERERLAARTEAAIAAEEERKPEFIGQTSQSRRILPYQEWDFKYFGHLPCPDCGHPHKMPGFHQEITQAIRDPNNHRVLVNLPPYHAKTTLISVRDTVYDICADPNSRTILVSKSLPFARSLMTGINELLTNPEIYAGGLGNLIEDYGPFKPYGDSVWSSEQIYVAGRVSSEKDPTVLVIGLGQQVYGRRAGKIKFDDVATLENQRNPARVQETLTWTDQEALTRIGKNGIAIWAGTRVHPGDIYHYLGERPGYKIIRKPVILDEEEQTTLWPDHFPWEQALTHRNEMKPAEFMLVYMQHDTLGAGASFTEEMMEACRDMNRVIGQREAGWRMIGGLDLAGGTKGSGYTCFTALGVDLQTGKRYIVDQISTKSMRAPEIKSTMLEWTDEHGIHEWRVESNGLQSQIVQYNREIIEALAHKGVRVVPHVTKGQGGRLGTTVNKWDPEWGVETMAPLFSAELYSIPWGNIASRQQMAPFVSEMLAFPMGLRTDRVMSLWFAEVGAKDVLTRGHLPMFDERRKVPARIRRGRQVIDFANRQIKRPYSRGGIMLPNSRIPAPPGHGEIVDEPGPFNVGVGE